MSATKTSVVVKERQHDYLYDPNYYLSSERDHQNVDNKSCINLSRMQKLFNFENLFSEIPVYRPFEWTISGKDPVPPSVSRRFRPVDVCRELIKMQIKRPGMQSESHVITGTDRPKFFSYLTSYANFYAPDDQAHIDLAFQSSLLHRNDPQSDLPLYKPIYVSRGVQTKYRESEAQTDPYSPQYVVNVGESPEVLTLASMGFGHGLPAGLHDVEMIERARERRNIEFHLKPYRCIAGDPKQIAERRKILENLETREWLYRELEVDALQALRLKVLVQLLHKREEHRQEIAAKRLDRKWEEQCMLKEKRTKTIQLRYITALRKLLRKRLAEKGHKRDVIKEYATPSSQVFAPLTRLGVFPDRGSENYVVKNFYLNTYEGLLELESSLPDYVLHPRIKLEQPTMYTKDGYLKREFRHQKELAELHDHMKGTESSDKSIHRKPRFLKKVEKPIPRPPTPTIAPTLSECTLERELSAIQLQSLIRGRAIQTQMYEGKVKRRDLIAELRSTHALLEDDQAQKEREKLEILNRQEAQAEAIHMDNQVDNVLSQFDMNSLANMLDFLSKELDRLLQERRVHALVLLAERKRRLLEAEESGNRQREERLRREYDEAFKQLVKVHENTIEEYLTSVAGLALDSTADEMARKETEQLAQKVHADTLEYEKTRDGLKSDELAAELVYNFLIPEVNKRAHEANRKARERKLLLAAHQEIWGPAQWATEQLTDAQKVELSNAGCMTETANLSSTSYGFTGENTATLESNILTDSTTQTDVKKTES